jgi:hypothetical protein
MANESYGFLGFSDEVVPNDNGVYHSTESLADWLSAHGFRYGGKYAIFNEMPHDKLKKLIEKQGFTNWGDAWDWAAQRPLIS